MKKQIEKSNLVELNPNSKEYALAVQLERNKYYELFSNTDLFCKMLEETDFDDLAIDADDFKKYVVDGKIYLGLDVTEYIELDDHHYLFDAFNVYYALNDFTSYNINRPLTKAWRKTLKTTYPNTSYGEDVKKVLKAELQEIVKKFNDDNVDLL